MKSYRVMVELEDTKQSVKTSTTRTVKAINLEHAVEQVYNAVKFGHEKDGWQIDGFMSWAKEVN